MYRSVVPMGHYTPLPPVQPIALVDLPVVSHDLGYSRHGSHHWTS